MKKADIEAQLARHPNTVFRCNNSYYQITEIVHEKGWSSRSKPTWRVKSIHIGFNRDTNTLSVGKEASFTMPLSKVDMIAFNDLEATETHMIMMHVRREKERAENKIRDERFRVLSQDIKELFKEIGTKEYVWVDSHARGSAQAVITMSFNDLEILFASLQASIKTGGN